MRLVGARKGGFAADSFDETSGKASPVSGRARLLALLAATALAMAVLPTVPATATPVCTEGYEGGPPLAACGGRIFPEAEHARAYVQYLPDPLTGFREFQHGIEYLAQRYPRWISIGTFSERFGTEEAVTAGPDRIRPSEEGDSGDGREIFYIKITDHEVPDEGKQTLLFSLSVHGNERGGLEGGLRTAEDLAMAAENGGAIVDGYDNYESTTGREPEFHEHEVSEVLEKEAVYLVDFNIDGWVIGDLWAQPFPSTYSRGNSIGTDLNRQMPTVGRINDSRNPLQESEMDYGLAFMEEVSEAGIDGLAAYGADVHGELTSNAYIDIMYPAGQFDSVDHRRLMAIAERTKSVIDATLYEGIIDQIEAQSGGNESSPDGPVLGNIPTKPAHWATVWDTLGYTDTGFIGDYLATDLAVTGMDYEIFLNHTVPDKVWNVYLQENHINGTRGIIKTAMAYALFQSEEFNSDNVAIDPQGIPGYVVDPDTVTDSDENGVGNPGGPNGDGIGADGEPIEQVPYDVTRMQWFADTDDMLTQPFQPVTSGQVADDPAVLAALDTLVLADVPLPADPDGASVDADAYYANLRNWVEAGGNLVLTDRALHALADLGVVDGSAVQQIDVYLPYTDIQDFDHPMVQGLRANARQLVDTTLLGYGITNREEGAWMSVVDESAWTEAGGHVVGATGGGQVSVGEVPLGDGQVRILGGALPTQTEANDHRFGLRDYAMTYTALFVMENAIVHGAGDLGADAAEHSGSDVRLAASSGGAEGTALLVPLALVLGFGARRRWRALARPR